MRHSRPSWPCRLRSRGLHRRRRTGEIYLWDALAAYTREHPHVAEAGMVGLALMMEDVPKPLRTRARSAMVDALVNFLAVQRGAAAAWAIHEPVLM